MLFSSAIMTAASGSVGGLTASRNRSGMYFRSRAVPTNPNTEPQQNVRSNFAQIATQWKELDQLDQINWDSYGAGTPITNPLGATHYLSGQQHFMRTNALRRLAGLSILTAAPVVPGLTELTDPLIECTAPDEIVLVITNTDPWATAVGGGLYVFSSRNLSTGVNFFKGPYQASAEIRVAGAVVPPTSPATVHSSFAMTAGAKVGVRAIAMDANGRLSQEIRLLTTVL